MKFIFLFLLVFTFSYSDHKLKEIAVYSKTDQKNKKHFELILTVIQELLNKNSRNLDIHLKFKINSYDNKKEVFKRYLKEDLLLLILSPYDYLKSQKLLDVNKEHLWEIGTNGQKREQYYLIANKKLKNPMKNIGKYKISTRGGNNGALYWFKSIIYKEFKKPFKKVIPKFNTVSKESKVVYDVFFNKNNLGLISKAGYELLSELNPQIKKHTFIVKKSKEIFLSMLALTSLRTNKSARNDFRKIINNINSFLKNSQLAASSSITHVKILKDDDIKELKKFYKEFYKYEKKYEK